MRSVLVFLHDTTEAEVAAYLDRIYPTQREPWLMLVDNNPCFYIDFYRDGPCELKPDVWAKIVERFGGQPAVGVIANISGRHQGDLQTVTFVVDLLTCFGGSAMDDYTMHLWSLAELQAGFRVAGHPFFDYDGWYAERKSDSESGADRR